MIDNNNLGVVDAIGDKRWHNSDGKLHREDGPAFISYDDIAHMWFVNGLLHRVDGPAIVSKNYRKEWWINGSRHRFDGPALTMCVDGKTLTNEWWINGHEVTDKINKWAKENDIDLGNLTEVDKALIKLVWGLS